MLQEESTERDDEPKRINTERLRPFALYDAREHPSKIEQQDLSKTIEEILGQIIQEGAEHEGITKTETEIAREIADRKSMEKLEKEIERIEKIRARIAILDNVPNRSVGQESTLRKLEKIILYGSERNKVSTLLTLKEKWPTDRSITDAQEEKTKILQKGIAQRLTGRGCNELKTMIKEILFLIQKERKRQGLPPYSRDGITMLIYEIIYEDYIWRTEKRKDAKTSYCRSHLRAAVVNHIKQGFTGLPSLLAALKHDSIEDLALHRKNCWKKGKRGENKEREYKPEWLFCDTLYRKKCAQDYPLERIKGMAKVTVEALTSPPETPYGVQITTSKEERDNQKAKKYLESVLENGFAATGKMIEQIHNAQTIKGVDPDPERQKRKMTLILKLHGLFAKVLELTRTEREITGAGIDFFKPGLREWFIGLQKERIRERLGLTEETGTDQEGHLLGTLLKKRTVRSTKETPSLLAYVDALCALSQETGPKIETQRQRTRRQIERVFTPALQNVVGIKIVPVPLEKYIDINRLIADREYRPEVTPDDPLFEVSILVKNPEDIWPVACDILKNIAPDQKSTLDPEKGPEDRPQHGLTMELVKNAFGGKIRIRVNSEKAEAEAKRGLRVDRENAIPDWVRRRIKTTLVEAEISGRPILDVAEEILLRKTIAIKTDGKKQETIYLPEGATFLDFAGALPTDKAREAVLYGVKAFRRDKRGKRVEVNMLDQVVEGDLCFIEVDTTTPHLDLGHLAFAQSEKTGDVARKAWNEKIQGEEKEKKAASIARAAEYLERVQSIFGIEQPEIMNIMAMQTLKTVSKGRKLNAQQYLEKKENALMRIGTGSFDPLKALARNMDRQRGCAITIVTQDRPGIFRTISTEMAKQNINMKNPNQKNTAGEKTKFSFDLEVPETVSNHQLLKLLLKLSYTYEVQVDPKLFTFHENRELTERLEELTGYGKAA